MCLEPEIVEAEYKEPQKNYVFFENQMPSFAQTTVKKDNHTSNFSMPNNKLKKNFFEEGYHSESVNISVDQGKTFASNYKEPKTTKQVQTPKSLSPKDR